MKRSPSIAERIVEVVAQSPGCLLDELVQACPDFTWNQIFLEIDRLSRREELLLTYEGRGRYRLHVPARDSGRTAERPVGNREAAAA